MESIVKYFEGEKLQCIIGAIFATICIGASIYFLFLQKPMLKGIAYSFLPLSAFLLVICLGVIVRTPKDIQRVTAYHKEQSNKMQSEELPRMEQVMRNFSVIKKVEIALFLIGIGSLLVFWNNPLIRGIAIGLVIQGFLLYLFDYAAESRGEVYMEFLKSVT